MLLSLTKQSDELKKSLLEAQKAGDTKKVKSLEKDIRALDSTVKNVKKSTYDYDTVLRNLNGSSIKQLEKAYKSLRNEVRGLATDSKEYIEKNKQLDLVKKRLDEVNGRVREQKGLLNRAADGFNKYFGITTAILATVTGLTYTFRNLSEQAAKMDDLYADVRKTTGLTLEAVRSMNEEFKNMNTRTSREQLNLLARDAGKLGISGREDVMQFVRAANQIQVALGEDLGDGAIRSIGKISDVFGETKKSGIEKSFLSIGSAINELGQNSTANEAYLVNFTQRLSGVSAQAGISVQNVLGFASALDQSGQAVEMSATALQKFIMKLYQDPAKFAKIAEQDVKEFTELLQNDTNAAITTVLRALNEKGGFAELVPIFKDMGLDGARAVGVLSALASNLDALKQAQDLSNKAFAEATSLTKEYNVKNDNMMGGLEKAKKKFKDTAIELGERLSPAMLVSTNATTYLIKGLSELFTFMSKYGGTVIKLVAIIGTYVVAVKAKTLWEGKFKSALTLSNVALKAKSAALGIARSATLLLTSATALLTGNITRARAAFSLFAKSIRANPFGLIAAAAVAAGIAIYNLFKKSSDSAETYSVKLNDVADAQKKHVEQVVKEKNEVTNLIKTITDANTSQETRARLLQELKNKYPEYLKYINIEKVTNEQLFGVLNHVNTAYKNKYKLAALQGKAEVYENSLVEIETRRLTIAEKLNRLNKMALTPDTSEWDEVQNLNGELDQLDKLYVKYQNKLSDFSNQAQGIQSDINKTFSPEGMEQNLEQLNKLIETYTKNLNAEREKGNQAAADYYRAEVEKLIAQKELLESQIEQAKKDTPATTNNSNNDSGDIDNAELKDRLKEVEKAYRQLQINLAKQRERNEIEESRYNAELYAAEIAFILTRIELHKQYGEDATELELELAKRRLKIQSDLEKASKDIDKKIAEERLKSFENTIRNNWKNLSKEIYKITQETEQAVNEAVDETVKERLNTFDEWLRLKKELEGENIFERRDKELSLIEELKEAHIISDEEEAKARGRIWMNFFEDLTQMAGNTARIGLNVTSSLQQMETARLNAEYEKRLTAAGDNAEQRALIEEERARKEIEIQKKYADANFAIEVLEISVAGITTAIQAYKALAGIPFVGPVLGAAAAAAVAVYTGTQIAAAKAERDRIKSISYDSGSSGGSSNISERIVIGKKDGGFTDVEREQDGKRFRARNRRNRGYISTPSILVSEEGTEFVANNEAVNNPSVRPVLDIINIAQQNGSISTLDLPAIISSSTARGFNGGGYTNSTGSTTNSGSTTSGKPSYSTNTILVELRELLRDLKENGVKAPIVLSELEKKKALTEKSRNLGRR